MSTESLGPGAPTREVKSNRAWREECEALREQLSRVRIVITMDGGLLQEVSSNVRGIEYVRVDYDTEGAAEDEIEPVAQLNASGDTEGHEDALIYSGVADYDPALVAQRFEEAKLHEEREP